ncbi:MAG: hypothetical protein JW915_00535 [Chitinispirillaceae bacterium]|nr:hypothetical protein [Chitinispirillaceae bacterium]
MNVQKIVTIIIFVFISFTPAFKVYAQDTVTVPLRSFGYGLMECCAFSPDGMTVATGSRDGNLRIWDLTTSKVVKTLAAHTSSIYGVAYSPDGEKIGSCSYDKTARVWNATTGELLFTIQHADAVQSIVFSADGSKIATGSNDNNVKLWNSGTGSAIGSYSFGNFALCVAFSPDGAKIVTGGTRRSLAIFDSETGSTLKRLVGHTDLITSVAFSPDGLKVLTCSYDRTARLWDALTGDSIKTFARTTAAAFSPDGSSLLLGSSDSGGVLLDIASGTVIRTFKGHVNKGVNYVAFCKDGTKILTGSYDQNPEIWDSNSGAVLDTLFGHSGWIFDAVFSPDGKQLFTGSDDGSARIWNVDNGDFVKCFSGHRSRMSTVDISHDGSRLLTGSFDSTVCLWDVKSGEKIRVFSGFSNRIAASAISPDGSNVIISDGNVGRLFNSANDSCISIFWQQGNINSLSFSSDGKKVLTADNTMIRLWEVSTGTFISSFSMKNLPILRAIFSSDDATILASLGGGDNDVRMVLWNINTGDTIRTFAGNNSNPYWKIAFSTDNSRIITGSNSEFALWNAGNGKKLRVFVKGSDINPSVAFSPAGDKVVTNFHDHCIMLLWDISDIAKIHAIAPFSPIPRIRFLGCLNNSLSFALTPQYSIPLSCVQMQIIDLSGAVLKTFSETDAVANQRFVYRLSGITGSGVFTYRITDRRNAMVLHTGTFAKIQ